MVMVSLQPSPIEPVYNKRHSVHRDRGIGMCTGHNKREGKRRRWYSLVSRSWISVKDTVQLLLRSFRELEHSMMEEVDHARLNSEVKREESRVEATEQVIGSQSKKVETSQDEEEQKVEIEEPWASSSTREKTKQEEKSEAREPPRRSRRRKGKPRKSS
uniref:Uncharacterized protein n=1 Tax=Salix viminalis TaxID=40686 RepID=A0A6N2LAU9_SALVM